MSRDQTERSKWSRKQAQSLILGIFLIIIIIIRCSGMFRNVPGCSEMFHVPGFIDGPTLSQSRVLLNEKYITVIYALGSAHDKTAV